MKIIFDIDTCEINILNDTVGIYGDNIDVKLNRHNKTADLRNMRFELTTEVNKQKTFHFWPPNGLKFLNTDQDLLFSTSISYPPSTDVVVKIVFTYNNNSYEKSIGFYSLEEFTDHESVMQDFDIRR